MPDYLQYYKYLPCLILSLIRNKKQEKWIDLVSKNRYKSKKSSYLVCNKLRFYQSSVVKTRKNNRYNKVKRIWKPNMAAAMKKVELVLGIKRKSWAIEK